jgi:hypothetical protein
MCGSRERLAVVFAIAIVLAQSITSMSVSSD